MDDINLEGMRFEFSQDRISEKSPLELGRYIGFMSGTDEQLAQLVAFVDAVQNYSKADGEAFQSAFYEARAARAYNDLNI